MKQVIISFGILLIIGAATLVIIRVSSQSDPFSAGTDSDLVDNSKSATTSSSDSASAVKKDPLYTEWKWQSSTDVQGKIMTPEDSSRFVLTFEPMGRLHSTTDCNSLSGSFIKDEEVISIGQLTTTLMACQGETLESQYASDLSAVGSYKIENDILTLVLVKDLGTMTFARN